MSILFASGNSGSGGSMYDDPSPGSMYQVASNTPFAVAAMVRINTSEGGAIQTVFSAGNQGSSGSFQYSIASNGSHSARINTASTFVTGMAFNNEYFSVVQRTSSNQLSFILIDLLTMRVYVNGLATTGDAITAPTFGIGGRVDNTSSMCRNGTTIQWVAGVSQELTIADAINIAFGTRSITAFPLSWFYRMTSTGSITDDVSGTQYISSRNTTYLSTSSSEWLPPFSGPRGVVLNLYDNDFNLHGNLSNIQALVWDETTRDNPLVYKNLSVVSGKLKLPLSTEYPVSNLMWVSLIQKNNGGDPDTSRYWSGLVPVVADINA